MNFYSKTIGDLLGRKKLSQTDSILVVCAGDTDRKTFLEHGFTDVVISNLDYHRGVEDYAPYGWKYIDAEKIELADCSFDWVVVHAGLHHCGSPHAAMCEMFRVARKGIVVFEARDSLLMKLSVWFGFVPSYELEPVVLSDGKCGGLRNTGTPNFIYRWTELEVEKTINSFSPEYEHEFDYFYGYRVPLQRLAMSSSKLKKMAAVGFKLVLPVVELLLRRQGNLFGFAISKQGALQRWLNVNGDEVVPDLEYMHGKMDTSKYRR